MFIRTWANILFLLTAAYGSYNVIAGKPYTIPSWQYYLCQLSPLLLLLGSLKAWHRSFTWRRIMTEKNISPKLSRGHHKPSRSNARPGILERGCLILFLMAIVGILKQLGMTNIPWLIGSIIGSLSLLRLAIGMVR